MAAASVYIARVICSHLLPLWGTLQDKQVGLTQGPNKLLLLPWVLEHVRFLCVPFRCGISYFPPPSMSPKSKPGGLQSQMLWGPIFLVQKTQAREPDVELKPLAAWENLCSSVIFVGHPPRGIDLTIP